jgi:F-type H+-transporting ATPase subunit b
MEALGIDVRYLAFQLVNFLLLFGILTFVIGKPLTKMLDQRRRDIAKGLEDAAKARAAIESAEKDKAKIIAEAEREGKKIIAEVRDEAVSLRKKLEAEAAIKAEKMLKRAEEEIEADRKHLKKELKNEIADMIVSATSKILKSDSSGKVKREDVERIVNEITQ